MRRVTTGLILAVALLVAGCSRKAEPLMVRVVEQVKDPHSFANATEVSVTHLDLDVTVDFDTKQIAGRAGLRLDNKTGARKLHLDTRDLTIERVALEPGGSDATFSVGAPIEHMGRELIIDITPDTQGVSVHYRTSPEAAAVQWLDPAQTAGGQKPFLFTQSQAILARTWVPCQDSPGVRMTYNARVKTRPDLLAIMSARNGTAKSSDGVYQFEMPQPIPSYLLALAVGDIEFRPVGRRSGVYAEPSVVDKAAWEFADMEKMIAAAEALYGPYGWERYDVIVLPPSFPFGGMENPRLTFATPTILAGDRSLVALIAHELAHSWSGNLVTNATWNDFWLNEGFTVYVEHRIMEAIAGRDYSEMLAQLGYQDLLNTIGELGKESPDTRLHLDLGGRDPDEGMTDIAYDKGYFFLRLIEEQVGRDRFDSFLKTYFEKFAFETMTTPGFVAYLRQNLIGEDRALEQRLKIDDWVYGVGLPDNCPVVESAEFAKVERQLEAWQQGAPARELDTRNWTTHHWLHFLNKLPKGLTGSRMAELDAAFNFTRSGNSEILNAWFQHAIANKYSAAYPALEDFLTGMGRRKFLRPLYMKLSETPEGLERARRIYARARPGYHSVSYRTIDDILKWRN